MKIKNYLQKNIIEIEKKNTDGSILNDEKWVMKPVKKQ